MENNIFKRKLIKIPWQFLIGIQAMLGSLALQEDSLTELEWGYYVNIPVIKWFFAIFQQIDGRGMHVVILMVCLFLLYYLLRMNSLQKNNWIKFLAIFFSICMVFGRSYRDLNNWNYIFHGRLQFGLACTVILGYYWVFKNILILLCEAVKKCTVERSVPQGRMGKWLFEKHPFAGPLLIICICCLPIMIVFFPGTLQWDAHEQLWTFMGIFVPWSTHHPVAVTWLLGKCWELSRSLFGSDSMTLFFYACPQYIIQWLVFAYGVFIISRLKAPIILRYCALGYFSIFPLWQIWGFTVVKDSYYYIFLLLLILLVIHILEEKKAFWWQYVLCAISSVMITCTRNNGIHVLVLFFIVLICSCKKYWKVWLLILISVFVSNYITQNIYVNHKGIIPGPVGEMLSIPLQQTGRYVKEHYDDITESEEEILSKMFSVELSELAEKYNPELSDPVKEEFAANPSMEDLTAYFKVWLAQLCRHPDTYIQAFLNQIYGYFYPDRYEFHEGIGRYYIGNAEHWQDGHLDMSFAMEYREYRDFAEKEADLVNRIPLIGMLYSSGFHNYILIGCVVALLANKKSRQLVVLVPSLLTVLVCLASPVNAYLRYMLPVMAALPVNLAWCFYKIMNEEIAQ